MTSHPLYVAFIWHQHQPLYRSALSGRYLMPWVRLHGTKDYLDLALMLERYPKLHQTFNLVPSLLMQIEDYIAGTAMDPWLEVLLKPVAALTAGDRRFVIERFFDANWENLIYPYPRYSQLLEMRQQHGTNWCLEHWQAAEYEDLLAWHNLCWFDPIFQEEDPQVRSWIARDSGFTLADREAIYAKQREIMSRIVGQHKIMQERGQIEVTTTPYTHPILPLLANTDSGRAARPQMALPRSRFHWPQDVRTQLLKGKENYQTRFDCDPRGLWPSEESVSPAVLPEVVKAGFKWLVSDEGVLGCSIDHFFNRDNYGHVQAPDLLYRPYLVETPAGPVSMVFRDNRLSDLIGFEYAGRPAEEAARDFIEQLEAISRLIKTQKAPGPHLVTVALDGENCWEYYNQDGKPFLEALYSRLSRHRSIKLVTVSEYLDRFGAERSIPLERLHSGSWINADFTTWIGDPVKNRAWELLAQARQVIEGHPRASEASWEALWAAEGSDWFWWFGYGHSSAQDALFDQLFREHLQALYVSLGEAIPKALRSPLERHDSPGSRVPRAFIQPQITGYGFEQEWSEAGCYEVGGARGTMHRSASVQRVWYGADHRHFYLRLDFGGERPQAVHLYWYYPHQVHHNSAVPLRERPAQGTASYQFRHGLELHLQHRHCQLKAAGEYDRWHDVPTSTRFAVQECLELAVPWEDLEMSSGIQPQFIVVLARDGRFEAAIPEGETLEVQVP
ncbi:glycoside hydrolase family 57 protein [Gloeobacter morelensis]|uniref:Glycoside hydrolase n=1 Tax=Gloeobacter morelensis MG652769 TaxID=2781736 RepID=A0ABY3PJW7_9CYAN|nr:glycoside hydrolase family 57 protein [Gloeobacter morelensis]UFP93928.1 glycoside hydrolase [Gloeobacter morelensis MG652769]